MENLQLTVEYKCSAYTELNLKYKTEKYMKNFIKWIKALRLYFVRGSSSEKHDCMGNREVIEHLPQYGRTIDGHDALLGDGYQVKCKICGRDWFQNYR